MRVPDFAVECVECKFHGRSFDPVARVVGIDSTTSRDCNLMTRCDVCGDESFILCAATLSEMAALYGVVEV